MRQFNTFSVKNKLLVFIIPTVSIIFLVAFYLILRNVDAVIMKSSYNEAQEIAKNAAGNVELEINSAFSAARIMSQVLSGYKDINVPQRTEMVDDEIKKIIKDNPNYKCVYTEWETEEVINPGSNSTGRFSSSFIYENNQIIKAPQVSLEEISTSDYYQLPKKTLRECLIEPYKYVYVPGGKEYLITSISIPVMSDNDFIGVAGMDFSLDFLQEFLGSIKPYETGYVILLSNGGLFVTHPKKEMVGKNISDALPELNKKFDIAGNIKQGKEFTYNDIDAESNENLQVFIIPVKIGRTGTPWSLGIVIPESKILEKTVAIRNISIILSVIAIIILAVVILFISTGVSKSINNLVNRFDQVFEIDKSGIKTDSNNEIDKLSEYIDLVATNQKQLAVSLMEQSKLISDSSEGLSDISVQAANASEELTAQINSVASTSEQVSMSIGTISSSAEEMASSIKEISKNTSTASKFVSNASERAKEAGEVMLNFEKSSTEIGNIIKTITTIAEQTNLLALNATIEAARAGEMGKGFAVVANEVKELAKESAKATEDITTRIKAIQEDSLNAANVIKEIIEITKQISDITNTIASAVEEQTVTTSEITRNLSDASKGTKDIAQSNNEILSSSSEYSNMAEKIKGSSSGLSKLALELEERLRKNYKI